MPQYPGGRPSPVPTVTLNGTTSFHILDERLYGAMPNISPQDQTNIINLLKDFIAEVEKEGDSDDYLRLITVLPGNETDTEGNIKRHLLDKASWQMTQLMRYARPCRIQEAVPYIQTCIAQFRRFHPATEKDVTPMLYLATSLSLQPGKEQDALIQFREAIDAGGDSSAFRTTLWARAHISRMLRRMGRLQEAKAEEEEVVNWYLWHPYAMSPSAFRDIVRNPDPQAEDHIMDNPDIRAREDNAVDLGNGMVIHFG